MKFDIEHYTLQDDPKTVAVRARDFFYPGETVNHRQFLVKMIEKSPIMAFLSLNT